MSEDPEAGARRQALAALARREHCRSELGRKLVLRGHDDDAVESVLDELEELHLLDDERFVEVFVRSRIARGQGPVRIAHELRSRQIPEPAIRTALVDDDETWAERARDILSRKFRGAALDLKERAKRSRFLEFRGFTRGQIAAALSAAVET